jgi:hypothetical protein
VLGYVLGRFHKARLAFRLARLIAQRKATGLVSRRFRTKSSRRRRRGPWAELPAAWRAAGLATAAAASVGAVGYAAYRVRRSAADQLRAEPGDTFAPDASIPETRTAPDEVPSRNKVKAKKDR